MNSGLRRFAQLLRTYMRSETGSSSVEFLLSLPFIVGMIAISSEFGRLILYQHVITQNLRGGVQYLSNIPLDVLRVAEDGGQACSSNALSRARSIILAGDPNDTISRYSWWSDPQSIKCSISLVDSIGTGSAFWVVELETSVNVDLPLLALTNTSESSTASSLKINASEKARLLEGL